MIIDIFYNKSVTSQAVAAWVLRYKYAGQEDSAGNINSITLRDVDGLATASVDAVTYLLSAASRHRIFNLTTQGTGTGQVSTAQIAYLKTKLIGKTTSALSDTDVVSILPTGGDGRSLPEIAWRSVWCYNTDPTYTGTATSGAATSLTDTGHTKVVNAYAGYYIQIISGTGIGQIRTITSNSATAYTVPTWTVNPDSTSVYVVSLKQPKPVPPYIFRLGATGYCFATGTATAGGATSLTDGGATFVTDAFIGKYCYIYDGTGQGQYAAITDNDGTSVTVTAWKMSHLEMALVVPDNTSKYIIVNNMYEGFMSYNVTNYFWTYMRHITRHDTEITYKALTDCYSNIFNTAPDAPVSFDQEKWATVLLDGQKISDYLMKVA
jgi:hypothetical protein